MEDEADQASTIRGFVRWATTLPQSIAVYFVSRPDRRAFVLCRHAEAEEDDRHCASAAVGAAQLNLS
jgi:hypothetical protein